MTDNIENNLTPDLEKGSNDEGYSLTQVDTNQAKKFNLEDQPELMKVRTSTNGDILYLGNQAFKRSDLENAFAGTLNPGIHRTPKHAIGNPVPLGLTGFCICAFVVSLVNCQARSVTNVNVIAACSLFFGGVVETVAGLFCLVLENTFAGTALGSFGGFWMGYAGILLDPFDIASSYETTQELNNAIGFYLMAWVIFAFLMWLCTFKATWPFFILFFLVWVFLLFLAIGRFTGSVGVTKAGGVFGLLATFAGFYVVYAGVATNENSYLVIPATPMPAAPRV